MNLYPESALAARCTIVACKDETLFTIGGHIWNAEARLRRYLGAEKHMHIVAQDTVIHGHCCHVSLCDWSIQRFKIGSSPDADEEVASSLQRVVPPATVLVSDRNVPGGSLILLL